MYALRKAVQVMSGQESGGIRGCRWIWDLPITEVVGGGAYRFWLR